MIKKFLKEAMATEREVAVLPMVGDVGKVEAGGAGVAEHGRHRPVMRRRPAAVQPRCKPRLLL